MAFNFFEKMLERVTEVTNSAMATGYGAVSDYVSAPLRVALVLYFLIVGFEYIRNPQRDVITDLPFRVIRVGLILTLIESWGSFGTYIFNGLWDVYETLGGAISTAFGGQASVQGLGAQLDNSLSEAVQNAMEKLAQSLALLPAWLVTGPLSLITGAAGGGDSVAGGPLALLGSVIELICMVAFHAVAFYSILLSQVGVALAVIFAPLFISLYLFDSTRGMADAWGRTVIGMLLLPAVVMGALAICKEIAGLTTNSSDFMTIIAQCLVYIGMTLFMIQMPSFASGLVGSYTGGQATAAVGYMAQRMGQVATGGLSDVQKAAASMGAAAKTAAKP